MVFFLLFFLFVTFVSPHLSLSDIFFLSPAPSPTSSSLSVRRFCVSKSPAAWLLSLRNYHSHSDPVILGGLQGGFRLLVMVHVFFLFCFFFFFCAGFITVALSVYVSLRVTFIFWLSIVFNMIVAPGSEQIYDRAFSGTKHCCN